MWLTKSWKIKLSVLLSTNKNKNKKSVMYLLINSLRCYQFPNPLKWFFSIVSHICWQTFFCSPDLADTFSGFLYLLRLVLISQTVVISTPADLWGRFHSPGARVPVVFPCTCSSWSIFYPGISRLAFIQGPLSSDCHLGRITLLVKIPERYHSVRKTRLPTI